MTTEDLSSSRESSRWFYVWMAGACALVAFGGFAPTYLVPVAAGNFDGPTLLHLHGILFFSWTLLFVAQTTFAATGLFERHRALGLASISLATAMLFAGFMAATYTLEHWIGTEYEAAARAATIVPVSAILTFSTLFAAAIANINRTEWHRRLMLCASISILPPAVARVLFVLFAHSGAARPGLAPPPLNVVELALAPGLAVDLLVVVAIVRDWRARGRPHPAYLVGASYIIAMQVLRIPLSTTTFWYSTTDWLVRFTS